MERNKVDRLAQIAGFNAPSLSRRRALQLFGAVGVAAVAGCSSVEPSGQPSSSQNGTSGAPRRGGTLIVGRTTDVETPDPTVVGPGNQIFVDHVHDKLVRWDSNYEMVPELAETLEVSPDGSEWTMELRQGVQFHSGRELTADDIEWNILRLREPDFAGYPFYPELSNMIAEIEKPDAHTVRLRLGEPTVLIQNLFYQLRIADREVLEGPDADRMAAGTGPFMWGEWVPGQTLRLVRNPNYWKSDQPFLDEIEARVIGDVQSLTVQVQGGQVLFGERMSLPDAARLQDVENLQVLTHEATPSVMAFVANVQDPALGDKRVRQAINYAIDRDRIAETSMGGFGRPQAVMWSPESPAYNAEQAGAYAFDLDEAGRLLSAAGVSDLQLDMNLSSTFVELLDAAEILRSDLEKVGVTLKIVQQEPTRLTEMLIAGSYSGLSGGIPGSPPFPAVALQSVPYTTLGAEGNYGNYQSDQYTEAVNAALNPALDEQARLGSVQDATEILLDESYFMPICTYPTTAVASSTVHGVSYDVPPFPRYHEAWID